MQAIKRADLDGAHDLDAYPDNFSQLPLLTSAQERDADLRKWAAVQMCLRLLVQNDDGRRLLSEFCQQCLSSPPDPESFRPRSSYFLLRRDVAHLLPGKPGAKVIRKLQAQLRVGDSGPALLTTIREGDFSATLVTGLTIVSLRHLGRGLRDSMADALCAWIAPWQTRNSTASGNLAKDTAYAVQRYLDNRDTLVLHNVRLVYKIALDNRHQALALSDLVQEGCAGLTRAAEKFDYRRGYRFSTYAYNWINQHVKRYSMGNGSLITYPAHIHQEINQLHRLRMQHLDTTGVDPNSEELAQIARLPVEKVRRLRSLNNITVGLEQPASEFNNLPWVNLLADPAAEDAASEVDAMLLSRLMKKRLRDLDDMERHIVRGRFGLLGGEPMTFRQLAEQLNISTEWARQLEKTALAKLRTDEVLQDAFLHT